MPLNECDLDHVQHRLGHFTHPITEMASLKITIHLRSKIQYSSTSLIFMAHSILDQYTFLIKDSNV